MNVMVATAQGVDGLVGRDVTALCSEAGELWAVVEGQEVWCRQAQWSLVASWAGPALTCLLPRPGRLLAGTTGAHLVELRDGALMPVASFDQLPERSAWYTPWGGPPDTRSLAAHQDATMVNVHVGGVARSDGGGSWRALVDIDVDVHQIAAAPDGTLMVATGAAGFGRSTDGGATWRWDHDGLHGSYCRAVALAGDQVLLSASTGPGRTEGAVYRRRLGSADDWARVTELVDGNIDTFWLTARDDDAAFVTQAGDVWVSTDAGATWECADHLAATPRAVLLA